MQVFKKFLVCILVVLAVALFSGNAFAQQSATVIGDFSCSVRHAGGGLSVCDPGLKGNSTTTVQTPSGSVILKCHCALPEGAPLPTSTEMTEGFGCNTPFGFTTDTRSVVTKKGRSNLTCTVNPSSP